jgi:hypothetical protein
MSRTALAATTVTRRFMSLSVSMHGSQVAFSLGMSTCVLSVCLLAASDYCPRGWGDQNCRTPVLVVDDTAAPTFSALQLFLCIARS